ncbi:hypothetical protein RSOLAG22IIIB_03698 [Rhizoctonia solani]|uniref:Uncharacterized protein n=1 Tax=Rhizoctonia solani TaxID=456999 RepID=A0A0K6FRM6_9AGAM|nr:hypothetical protein RSOLAG22IIIB_03698 [Rhizoctonia solani]
MVHHEGADNNSRPSIDHPRPSDETLVGQPEAGPLPSKQGEIGYVPPPIDPSSPSAASAPNESGDLSQLPARHPADRSPSPPQSVQPGTTMGRQPSSFKQFLRTPRPLPAIYGVRAATAFRVIFITCTLIASIIGWIVAVIRMKGWDEQSSVFQPPPQQNVNGTQAGESQWGQMTHSSLVFVHVAFGSAVLFQLLVLERSVYRFRAERYAHLHPEEVAATTEVNGVMGLSPWNRPPLPTYAAALGVRGTGDVEDNVIAAPPPPEYGNTRGSTLILASHFSPPRPNSSASNSETRRDALGRPVHDWSRPVSYGEDEMRENLRRSLDLEAALARLEGPTRPESALTRR